MQTEGVLLRVSERVRGEILPLDVGWFFFLVLTVGVGHRVNQ